MNKTDNQNTTVKIDAHICFACPCLSLKVAALDALLAKRRDREALARIIWKTFGAKDFDEAKRREEDPEFLTIFYTEDAYEAADALLAHLLPEQP